MGQVGELKAPHNDTKNLQDYLVNVCGFDPSQMLVLMDDGTHPPPTRKNIEAGFERLVRYSQPGDVVFLSFSGHGGQVADKSGASTARRRVGDLLPLLLKCIGRHPRVSLTVTAAALLFSR